MASFILCSSKPLALPCPCRQTPLSVLEEACHSVSKQKLLARFFCRKGMGTKLNIGLESLCGRFKLTLRCQAISCESNDCKAVS